MTSPSPAIQAVPEKDGLFYAPEAESPGSLFRRAPHRERTPPDRDAFPMSFYDYSDLFMMKNGVFVEIFSYILSNRLFLYTN